MAEVTLPAYLLEYQRRVLEVNQEQFRELQVEGSLPARHDYFTEFCKEFLGKGNEEIRLLLDLKSGSEVNKKRYTALLKQGEAGKSIDQLTALLEREAFHHFRTVEQTITGDHTAWNQVGRETAEGVITPLVIDCENPVVGPTAYSLWMIWGTSMPNPVDREKEKSHFLEAAVDQLHPQIESRSREARISELEQTYDRMDLYQCVLELGRKSKRWKENKKEVAVNPLAQQRAVDLEQNLREIYQHIREKGSLVLGDGFVEAVDNCVRHTFDPEVSSIIGIEGITKTLYQQEQTALQKRRARVELFEKGRRILTKVAYGTVATALVGALGLTAHHFRHEGEGYHRGHELGWKLKPYTYAADADFQLRDITVASRTFSFDRPNPVKTGEINKLTFSFLNTTDEIPVFKTAGSYRLEGIVSSQGGDYVLPVFYSPDIQIGDLRSLTGNLGKAYSFDWNLALPWIDSGDLKIKISDFSQKTLFEAKYPIYHDVNNTPQHGDGDFLFSWSSFVECFFSQYKLEKFKVTPSVLRGPATMDFDVAFGITPSDYCTSFSDGHVLRFNAIFKMEYDDDPLAGELEFGGDKLSFGFKRPAVRFDDLPYDSDNQIEVDLFVENTLFPGKKIYVASTQISIKTSPDAFRYPTGPQALFLKPHQPTGNEKLVTIERPQLQCNINSLSINPGLSPLELSCSEWNADPYEFVVRAYLPQLGISSSTIDVNLGAILPDPTESFSNGLGLRAKKHKLYLNVPPQTPEGIYDLIIEYANTTMDGEPLQSVSPAAADQIELRSSPQQALPLSTFFRDLGSSFITSCYYRDSGEFGSAKSQSYCRKFLQSLPNPVDKEVMDMIKPDQEPSLHSQESHFLQPVHLRPEGISVFVGACNPGSLGARYLGSENPTLTGSEGAVRYFKVGKAGLLFFCSENKIEDLIDSFSPGYVSDFPSGYDLKDGKIKTK